MTDNQDIKVIPFYFVADVSDSMKGPPIDALNKLLPKVMTTLDDNRHVGDLIRFSLLSFSDETRVELPLSNIRHVRTETLPVLRTRRSTCYSKALHCLKRKILEDDSQLRNDKFTVKRSIALFLSDGVPTEDASHWEAAFNELTSIKAFPNIIPIGIGKCDRQIMMKLRHRKFGRAPAPALFTSDDYNVAEKIAELIEGLTKSMIASAQSLLDGNSADGGHAGAVFECIENTPGWDAEYD